MVSYSLLPQLMSINPNWSNKSRIFGQAIENWIQESFHCECLGKFSNTSVNSKSVDSICNSCGQEIQIKGSKKKFKANRQSKLKIIGAEYKTTLESIASNSWDLILVSYNETTLQINQILRIKSDLISENCIIPRKKLSENARRAGWQGCYLEFHWDSIDIIYNFDPANR